MITKYNFKLFIFVLLFFCTAITAIGKDIVLPEPDMTKGRSLMESLSLRRSIRSFDSRNLSSEHLSGLLWAAFGVNRKDRRMRTAPSACNWQEIDVYVALKSGLYLYDAVNHKLVFKLEDDLRQKCGKQDFTGIAPVNLIFVADYSRMSSSSKTNDFYSATDTGYISQNVYLYCASMDLATVVLGMVDKKSLRKDMKLSKDQRIVLTQPVAYPVNTSSK